MTYVGNPTLLIGRANQSNHLNVGGYDKTTSGMREVTMEQVYLGIAVTSTYTLVAGVMILAFLR
jgi:hypothetical protein